MEIRVSSLQMNKSLAEEREALKLIYGEDLFWNSKQVNPSVQLFISNYRTAVIQFHLPPEYPQRGLPQVLVQARWISEESRRHISTLLKEKFGQEREEGGEGGGPILYEITEFCREQLENIYDSHYGSSMEQEEQEEEERLEASSSLENTTNCSSESLDEWCLGQVVIDRKSVFQGLVINVEDEKRVDSLLNTLHQHRKIGSATHLIASWRILTSHGSLIQDWDDDGEKGAGHRILQLLISRDIRNVLLVVCRWFGGVLLGPARFHRIQQAAKSALDEKSSKPFRC